MTRYDIMQSSKTQVDSADNQPYPDPLSVNYNQFYYSEPPLQTSVDETLIHSPFLITAGLYGEASYDDIVFMLNNVPHVSLLAYEQILNYPVIGDFTAFAGSQGK